MYRKSKKISILGVGNVGATIAYTLASAGSAAEIVLVDINKEKAKGEAMDIIQGSAVGKVMNIYAADYEQTADSDIVIVTVGMGRKPGQTRLDLAQTNVNIVKQVMPQVVKYAPNAVYVIVSNPVDIITYTILKTTGLDRRQVIGTGTMLDTSRLRNLLSAHVGINAHNLHAYVFGEHGDTSMIPWSLVTVAGMRMSDYCKDICDMHNNCGKDDLAAIEEDMRTSGAKVIASKGATFYAIAAVVKRIVDSIFNNAKTALTVSSLLEGEYGIEDVCMSIPFVIGDHGIERSLSPRLTAEELVNLNGSADALKKVIRSIEI